MENKRIIIQEEEPNWKGYDFQELKIQRAIIFTKKEIQKEKLLQNIQQIKNNSLLPTNIFGNVAGKIFSKISILDYALMGFKLTKKAIALWKFFTKNKRD